MKLNLSLFTSLFLIIFLIQSCSDDDINNIDNNVVTTAPIINSLVTDKTEIEVGSEDFAIVTCDAEGGNLNYEWFVDLGDLFFVDASGKDKSKVYFSAASCCVGEKVIKCTVSNDKGEVKGEVNLTVLAELDVPRILNTKISNETINKDGSSVLDCYAFGQRLTYTWTAEHGSFEMKNEEGWQVEYFADGTFTGVETITCTVSNIKGSVDATFEITIE